MPAPSIIIIASPYEGELLGRALSDTGLRILRADGGDGASALLTTELPLAVVVGTSLFGADPAEIVAQARARQHNGAVYLLAQPDDPLIESLRSQVTAVFRRPADFDALAHQIERLAVEVEQAEIAELDELGAVEVEAGRDDVPPPPPQPWPRVPTEPIEPDKVAVSHNGNEALAVAAPSLLRADDALALVGIGFDEMPAAPVVASTAGQRAFDNRSTIAREFDRELQQAERRLFPDATATPLPFGRLDDYDDALGDIDLDSLAIDTIPGLISPGSVGPAPMGPPMGPSGAERLQLDESRPRGNAPAPSGPPPQAPPVRPVQEEGSLAELDVTELLARLHAAAFTGELHIERPEGDKRLYLDHGEPVGARSSLRHDQLAELLYREGKLTREQVARLKGLVVDGASDAGSARPVAQSLVSQGLLKEAELYPTVRRHLEELFFSLFSLTSGHYRLGPELPPAEDRVRLSAGPWAMILEGVRRKYGLERLSGLLGGRETVLRPTTLFPRAIEAAALTDDERRVAALFDGARTLGEVRAALGGRVAESVVFAVAFGLRALGALESGAGAVDLRYASTVVTGEMGTERRAQPRGADPQQLAAERAVEKERIAVKRAQILDADYFTILGLDRNASDHELRRAHARLRADFDPARFIDETVAEQGEALSEIREVLDEALRVLSAPEVRARYAAHLEPVATLGAEWSAESGAKVNET